MKSRKMTKQPQAGFTLIELMIVVAIIGILAAIALPAYTKYMDKSKFVEVVQGTQAAKTAVEICAQDTGALTACGGGSNGVPDNIAATPAGVKYLASVTTADNGMITATSKAFGSVAAGTTYTLTPNLETDKSVTWVVGGTCLTAGVCKATPP